ncbi:cartilage matrix protein-like [Haliotis asinina]|uniref:cartilage matrix protein-like n=1 Tax=Haliotis asinina TaxID=109174 RepID=UPI0035323694
MKCTEPKKMFLQETVLIEGMLRVGGRLSQAEISFDAKHPIILPKESHVTTLIIRDIHNQVGHLGKNVMLAILRQEYWILHASTLIKNLVAKCVICRKYQAREIEQKISDLPLGRVTPDEPPFTSVQCEESIRSDNGTNLVGCERELREEIENWNHAQINSHLMQKNVSWNFNPPADSHHGGVWERVIRTVRKVLYSLLHQQVIRLDDQCLVTLFCEVESIINGRPSQLHQMTLVTWPPSHRTTSSSTRVERRRRQCTFGHHHRTAAMGLSGFEKVVILAICVCLQVTGSWQAETTAEFKSCESACRQKPMDVTFVIDASSSIWPENFTMGLWFVEDFVDIFQIQPDMVRVAAVSYGDRVYTEDAFGFDKYTSNVDLKKAITNIPYRAGPATETGAGIRYMRETFLPNVRKDVRKVCIVLTDGNSQKPDVTESEARIARDAGVEMFVVGVGRSVSEDELRNIAGVDEHVFVVTSYNLLGTIRSRLAFETCDENPPEPPVVCRDNPIDISFVIDASSSIGDNNFTLGMDFVKSFVTTFDVSPQRARFSVITYGRGTYDNTAFGLDAYANEVDVVNAITNIPYTAGDYTDTGLGIEFMRQKQMLPKQRPHAAHIAIVMTDGQSQDWEKTQKEAAKSRDDGISMFAIGVGVNLSQKELLDIAGDPDRVYTVDDYKALDTIRQDLDDKTCTIASVKFQPNGI